MKWLIVNPGDLKGKRPKLCAGKKGLKRETAKNPQGDTTVQEFEAELESSIWAVVDLQNDRSVVPKIRKDEIGFKFCRRFVM